jgi:hypothetical protein
MGTSPFLAGLLLALLSLVVDALRLSSILDTLVGHGLLVGAQWALACACARGLPARAFDAPPPLRALPFTAATALLCGLLGVALDGDHFLAARSLSLRAALALPARPFGHSAAFLVGAVALAGAAAGRGLAPAWAPLLLGVAIGSHQMRDATKRGVLPWPGAENSAPLPLSVFYAAMAASPLLLARALEGLVGSGGGGGGGGGAAPPRRACPLAYGHSIF